MARKEIKAIFNDNELNKMNSNFKELYDEFGNVVDTVTEKAFDKVVDSAKINWGEPVDTFDNLPSNASNSETRMTRDDGKIYRFDGSIWREIQDIDPTAINEVDSRLSSQLADIAIDVKQFDSLQSAIDLIGSGQTLLFSDGNYDVPTMLDINKPLNIIFNKNAKLISTNESAFNSTDGVLNINSPNVTIKGEGIIDVNNINMRGINANNSDGLTIEGVSVLNSGMRGIGVSNSNNVLVKQVYTENCMN